MLTRDEDGVVCHECGRTYRALGSHVWYAHGMTAEAYRRAHGLGPQTALVCEGTSRTISEQAAARVGSDAWERFTAARDAVHADAVQAAVAAMRGRPQAESHRRALAAANQARAGRQPKTCRMCGREYTPTRNSDPCSPACVTASQRRAARLREAARAGEPADGVLRAGSGPRVTIDELAARLGVAEASIRTAIRRGSLPPHDGRTDGTRWWWTSTLDGVVSLDGA